MLGQSARISRTTLGRLACKQMGQPRRTFITPTAVRNADFVQDLYLNQLKSYKPTPVKASDSEGHVQKFVAPKPPKSPEEGNLSSEMKSYQDQQVDVEGQAAGGEAAPTEDWFEPDLDDEESASAH